MKNIFIITLILFSLPCFPQKSFSDFISDLPSFDLPLNSSVIKADKIIINRQEAWDYLIVPVSGFPNKSIFDLNTFLFDTSVIKLYKQFENKDMFKNEPIHLYCPTRTGDLYCLGKTSINKETIGILWFFQQQDVEYGKGPHIWLATYSNTGQMTDYLRIYCSTTTGLVNPEDKGYTKTERSYRFVNTNELIIKQTFTPIYSKKEPTIRMESYTIDKKGMFVFK